MASFALLLVGATGLAAQQVMPAGCTYQSCALAISARWNGLAVVRGHPGDRVATLNFFVPRDVSPSFTGADSAVAWALRATQRRRVAAAFTDAGLAIGAAGAVVARRRSKVDATSGGLMAAGAAAFLVSVPIQFAADNALSRAVWWYNSHFAR